MLSQMARFHSFSLLNNNDNIHPTSSSSTHLLVNTEPTAMPRPGSPWGRARSTGHTVSTAATTVRGDGWLLDSSRWSRCELYRYHSAALQTWIQCNLCANYTLIKSRVAKTKKQQHRSKDLVCVTSHLRCQGKEKEE